MGTMYICSLNKFSNGLKACPSACFKSVANIQPNKVHGGQWMFVHLGCQTFKIISQGKMYQHERKSPISQ